MDEMALSLWLSALVLVYVIFFWVIVPRIVPLMRKQPLPSRIPRQLEEAIGQLERDSNTPYEYIRNAADYILSQAHGGRVKTLTHPLLAFETDTKTLLARRGFMHCHQLNHLMRLSLARSRFFSDEQIAIRTAFVNFNIHQYLQVRIAGQWYDVDLGAAWMGVPLGKHAWGFR